MIDKELELQEALRILKQYNKWRRPSNDDEVVTMPDPKEIGIALDTAIEHLENSVNIEINKR